MMPQRRRQAPAQPDGQISVGVDRVGNCGDTVGSLVNYLQCFWLTRVGKIQDQGSKRGIARLVRLLQPGEEGSRRFAQPIQNRLG